MLVHRRVTPSIKFTKNTTQHNVPGPVDPEANIQNVRPQSQCRRWGIFLEFRSFIFWSERLAGSYTGSTTERVYPKLTESTSACSFPFWASARAWHKKNNNTSFNKMLYRVRLIRKEKSRSLHVPETALQTFAWAPKIEEEKQRTTSNFVTLLWGPFSWFTTNSNRPHFRITFSLFLKANLGAHPFTWKWVYFASEWNLIFIWKDEHQDSLWGGGLIKVIQKWPLIRSGACFLVVWMVDTLKRVIDISSLFI